MTEQTTETVETDAPETEETVETTETETEQPDTFPREYVEQLRRESAEHRTSAREAREALEPVQTRLHTALVAATGRLADASDLPFDAAHLDDEAALSGAIDALLEAKPHLASRRVSGDVGQGVVGSESGADLGGMLRARA